MYCKRSSSMAHFGVPSNVYSDLPTNRLASWPWSSSLVQSLRLELEIRCGRVSLWGPFSGSWDQNCLEGLLRFRVVVSPNCVCFSGLSTKELYEEVGIGYPPLFCTQVLCLLLLVAKVAKVAFLTRQRLLSPRLVPDVPTFVLGLPCVGVRDKGPLWDARRQVKVKLPVHVVDFEWVR